MRPHINHRFWILITWYISAQCILGYHQQIKNINGQHLEQKPQQEFQQKENQQQQQQQHHQEQQQLTRQIADNDNKFNHIETTIEVDEDVDSKYFDDNVVSHPSQKNEHDIISRPPFPRNGVVNETIAKNPKSTTTVKKQKKEEKSSVSYLRENVGGIGGDVNDNNVEGGGDKEFHTEDLFILAKKHKTIVELRRHRRATSMENQYNASISSSGSQQYHHHHQQLVEQKQQQQQQEKHHQKHEDIHQQQISNSDNTHVQSISSLRPPPPPPPPVIQTSSLVQQRPTPQQTLSSAAPAAAAASGAAAATSHAKLSVVEKQKAKIANTNSATGAAVPSSSSLSSAASPSSSSQISVNSNIQQHSYQQTLLGLSSSDNTTGYGSNNNNNQTTKSETITSNELNVIENQNSNSNEQIIIISNGDGISGGGVEVAAEAAAMRRRASKPKRRSSSSSNRSDSGDGNSNDLYMGDEPKVLPLRPIIRGPYDDAHQGEMTVVYAEPHTEIKLNCDVDLDILSTVWMKDGQMVHTTDRNSRPTDNRFIRELRGGLTITNAMLEDDGKWQCEAENARGYVENARPVKLVVLDRPKPPYLLIDSRRLDAGNIFVPVKENSELSLACISEGGNPKPTLTWEVLLSPGVDRHAQKVAAEVLELQEVRNEKEKDSSAAVKSEARLPAVYRAHHNARILCVMEHPTLKMRQNASILLDVQYTPSFAISRTPGFGYPLREGIEVSLKCDVDSNPPSTPLWQKDDTDTPVPQNGDGFLNFTAIRREHSGWYKCTSRHLNFQYSSIGYYLSIRYDSVDVTSEPLEQDISVAASHTPNKRPQLEVQLGGAVTLQCPQGSLGCWSHLDPVTAKLRGLGIGLTTPTGQFSLKDVVYQDAGIYKCIGQSTTNNKKKVEIIHTVAVQVKGSPTVSTRNHTPVAYPGSPLHLSVEFCANPPAFAARWLHGDRIYTPGNQYGIDVLAYGVIDLPTPYCKEARLTYVHMHERVPRTFHFVVSSPTGVAETIFNVNFTLKHKVMSNSVDDDDEELSEPEEIHFPVFGSASTTSLQCIYCKLITNLLLLLLWLLGFSVYH